MESNFIPFPLEIWLISSVSLQNSANLLCLTSIFGSDNISNSFCLHYSVTLAQHLRHRIEAIEKSLKIKVNLRMPPQDTFWTRVNKCLELRALYRVVGWGSAGGHISPPFIKGGLEMEINKWNKQNKGTKTIEN